MRIYFIFEFYVEEKKWYRGRKKKNRVIVTFLLAFFFKVFFSCSCASASCFLEIKCLEEDFETLLGRGKLKKKNDSKDG